MENRLGTIYFDLTIVSVKTKVVKATDVALHTFPVLLLFLRAAEAPSGLQQILLLPGNSRILARWMLTVMELDNGHHSFYTGH